MSQLEPSEFPQVTKSELDLPRKSDFIRGSTCYEGLDQKHAPLNMKASIRSKLSQVVLRTVLIYAVFGALWILVSDAILHVLISEEVHREQIQIYKGWAFVVVTALLLYASLYGQLKRWEREAAARRKAEEALQKSEEHLQHAAQISRVGTFEQNHITSEIYFSPILRQIYGFKPKATITLDLMTQRFFDEDRNTALKEIQRGHHPESNGDFAIEHRIVTPDGDIRWLHTVSKTFFEGENSSRHPLRTVGAVMDITDRKRAEEAIHRSQERYRALVETSFDLIWELDTEGRYTFTSRKILDLLGYTPEEMVGRAPYDFMSLSEGARVRRLLHAIMAEQRSFASMEKEYLHKDGRIVVLESSGVPVFGPNKEFRGYRGNDRNITDRKLAEKERQALEAQLRQAQKMEAIGTLAGGVAHDFNNILTVIHGNASLLLGAQADPAEKTEYAQQIVKAAERAASLTRQLLMFSRKQVMQLSNINLNEAVGQMTKMLQRILGEDIALQTNYSPNLGVIRGDIGMIEQILLNLAVNSRDAMPSGGTLTIGTGTDMLSDREASQHPDAAPGLHVWLSVSDTGCGISAENLPRIFEPFFTTKEVGKGTGLGLATVYGIVKQHRGWIHVTSEINKGTTIRIHLPALPTALIERKAPTAPKTMLPGSETILIAEDDPAVRGLVISVLERCGYTVLSATSGAEALTLWKANKDRVDLLVTDVVMPEGLTGLQLAEKVQAEKPGLKVLYMTGYSADLAGKNTSLIEGINFLQKPFAPESLARALRVLLKKAPANR
jgi:PAS domain S-box-containing protein